MSVHLDPSRAYRAGLVPGPGETAFQAVVEESDLYVVARADLRLEVTDFLTTLRAGLKNYILFHPEFRTSLTPVEVSPDAPGIALAMARAARICNVGPMAAVAGAVAQAVADRFQAISPDILVENGGDLYIHSTRERLAALLALPVNGARLALRLGPGDFPVALCGSSARIGPSLSFGAADLVTVKARSGALADAAATTLGNLAQSARVLPQVVARAKELEGVLGIFAQVEGSMAVWGDMELVALED